MTRPETITIAIDRRILEHPEAVHIHRMRAAIWLYLVLLSRPRDGDSLEIVPAEIGKRMGLPEGTIRSWLGHLRKWRYLEARRTNGTVIVDLKRQEEVAKPPTPARTESVFTPEGIARALGEPAEGTTFAGVIREHSDAVIRRALARALAVPSEKIRRSRTALFIYFLKHHDEKGQDHSRH